MSTSSNTRRASHPRIGSLQRNGSLSRDGSRTRTRIVSQNDAYTFALRAAYLSYLLQPRTRRTQHVVASPKPVQRSSSSIHDLMKDFSLIRDSKSRRFPHKFMDELEKRLANVLMGKEKSLEFQDAAVKRSFAAFFNAFTEQSFKKRMEKDRRVEDLVLIFFSNATKELQKGKLPTDDSWKLMADRHLALFIRLISLVLKEQEWARDRPELTNRLATLEIKLLTNDQDLTAESPNGGVGGSTVEVLLPLSHEVKDMPLVQVVARIFGVGHSQVQSDIDSNKTTWTARAALQDIKTYRSLLELNSRKTLRSDDFDLEDAYESWKKAEGPELTQMILAIVQANPELAKRSYGQCAPQVNSAAGRSEASDSGYSESSRKLSTSESSNHVADQSAEMSVITPIDSNSSFYEKEDETFTFIPPDPRTCYRLILTKALSYDLKDDSLPPSNATKDVPALKPLSKQSTELLNEICLRWRIPYVSRIVLFLDVIREKFLEQAISLDTLDAAFEFIKAPLPDNRKDVNQMTLLLLDRTRWTLQDFALNQQILKGLHEALLRDLYDVALRCYEPKPPSVGQIIYVLEHHIYDDPNFSKPPEDTEAFSAQLIEGLREKSFSLYKEYLAKLLPQDQKTWEFYHVMELGKAVVTLAQRIQKRYRKNAEIMGANPLTALVETMLPLFAEDARDIIARILQLSANKNEEVPLEDGFALYGELIEIRRIHSEALPSVEFAFHIEELLADFVWRWIRITGETIGSWVDEAVKQDNFQVRVSGPGHIASEEERHSVSVVDIFTSFNQTIDRVVQLNWDDDLQYAKFMTALAKVVGNGIARYCDVLEQRFSKEMDRLTPEQEASANQTRQEKWMQLAKDAWSNKEKIEPFQFFPESFVKLNNIEFAVRQLDKLEREVNVDACADVIEKHTPPVNLRQRKVNNYVFTIKIVEAEDLKACDPNGSSDPYVVLGDEYQKRLAKTRIIYANLNPRWDETVDITTQGPLNIVATVWDWDMMGDHDCVGRTSIKLDPSHFSDFMPREYWLDLDTQGRLLLRLSAYIHHCLSRRALRSLLSKGLTMSSVSSYFSRNRPQSTAQGPTQADITEALKPLIAYFDDNFAIMNQTLTRAAMAMVLGRLWKEVLVTLESLIVPPLSDKASQQRQLTQQELDIVFKWLQVLLEFFNAPDEETGEVNGVPLDVLQSPKFYDLKTVNFFYFDSTENLIRTSERMASATAARQQSQRNRLSAPAALASMSFGGASGLLGTPSHRKSKSIMLSRNLGTMKKAKEEKRKEAQAEPNDDMILRILRMRPEAERYLRDRSRQKERLAAAAAAELIVRQSIMAGGGRMTGSLPRR